MSFLQTLAQGSTRAATLATPPDWLISALGVDTSTGPTVSINSALGLVPVYSAVSLIAGTIGTLPMVVYKGEDRDRAKGNSDRLLHQSPNAEMAADEVWEIVASHLLLWGNAFLYKIPGGMGAKELWPISPSRVSVCRVEGKRTFLIDNQKFTEDQILHIRGLSDDGLVGYSPIQKNKQAVANALAQEQFVADFLGKDGRPSVILTHPNELSKDAADRLKARWNGVKAGGAAVLEEGITVEQWTMPLNDAQFIEQQQYSDLRIAQMFNLPPSKLGAATGDSLTYATTESQGIDFLTYTLRRWLVRIEKSLKRDTDLLLKDEYAEFLVDGLLRADSTARAASYTQALAGGWMTTDEVRARENLPPLPPQEKPNASDSE